jgi:hypothetical protein
MTAIDRIARTYNITVERVNDIIDLRQGTRSKLVADKVSALTGEPASVYLITKGVRIDPIQKKEMPWTREPSEMKLQDLIPGDLMQLLREVRELEVSIWKEMQARLG